MRLIKIKDHTFYSGYDNKNCSIVIVCKDEHYKSILKIIKNLKDEDDAYQRIIEKIKNIYPETRIITFENDNLFDDVIEI